MEFRRNFDFVKVNNRNSDFEIEIKIAENQNIEISTKLG
jgi:hypothetical protein